MSFHGKNLTFPNILLLTAEDLHRFHSKIDFLGKSLIECHEWTGYKDEDGYGQFSLNGKLYRSSRVMKFISTGKDPGDLIIRHTCDNPPCCNDNHLVLGTTVDNSRDCLIRGRHGTAKLTIEEVLDIRYLRFLDISRAIIAKQFNISESYVTEICRRATWAFV